MGMPSDMVMVTIWEKNAWRKDIEKFIQIFLDKYERVWVSWQPLLPSDKTPVESNFSVKSSRDIQKLLLEIEESFKKSSSGGIRVHIRTSWGDRKQFP